MLNITECIFIKRMVEAKDFFLSNLSFGIFPFYMEERKKKGGEDLNAQTKWALLNTVPAPKWMVPVVGEIHLG